MAPSHNDLEREQFAPEQNTIMSAVAGAQGIDFRPSVRTLGAHPNATPAKVANLVLFPDNDAAINLAIGRFQDGLSKWKSQGVDLARLVRDVRDWSSDLWCRFVPEHWNGRPVTQPPLLFRFQCESDRVLGHYRPGRNDAGLRFEISINPRHLGRHTEIDIAGIVLHELLHCFEDVTETAPGRP